MYNEELLLVRIEAHEKIKNEMKFKGKKKQDMSSGKLVSKS
jgi:hypothetical protein